MKRKNGEGSWGTKTIKGTVYQYYRQDNNYTYGRTIKEVKEKLKNKSSCKSATSKIHTLKNYGMDWLRTVKALELEARTYDEYENIIEKRIGDHSIGNRQLQSITSDTWQSFINEFIRKICFRYNQENLERHQTDCKLCRSERRYQRRHVKISATS